LSRELSGHKQRSKRVTLFKPLQVVQKGVIDNVLKKKKRISTKEQNEAIDKDLQQYWIGIYRNYWLVRIFNIRNYESISCHSEWQL